MTDILRNQPPLHIKELQNPGTIFEVDDRRFIWNGELGDGEVNVTDYLTGQLHRVIDPSTGLRQVAQAQWIQDAISKGTFRVIVDANGSPVAEAQPPRAELDRDEMLAIDPYAEARQILLQKLHELRITRSDPNLSGHVERVWAEMLADRFGERPATETVRDWMIRTDPALPLLSELLSRSGRVERAKRLDPLVREIVKKRMDWYWDERGRQIKDAEAAGNSDIRALNGERRSQGMQPLKIPSREAYRREIRASECRENFERKYGKVAAERYWRASGAGASARYALAMVMMDDTVLDAVACIQTKNGRRFPAGRPYIVVAIDLHTRCIVGWVLSFKPPSVHTAVECLKRVGSEKMSLSAEWVSRYPVLRQIGGRPTEVLTDNGSNYNSAAFQDNLAESGITLSYAAIRSPKSKAVVERFFRTLNTWLLAKLPGSTLPPKVMRELGYDPAAKAVLLVEELEALIQEFINTYHVSMHTGIHEQPAAAWLRSIEARPRPVFNTRSLELMTYVTVQGRRLTVNGVRWKYLTYRIGDVDRLLKGNLASEPMRTRLDGTAACTVKIKVDPENVGHIWVWDASTSAYVELHSTQHDYAWGLTLDQHLQARQWAKRNAMDFNTEEERMEVLHALNEYIEEIIPNISVRERRALAKYTQGQIGTARSDLDDEDGIPVPILHADARHDGMGEIVEHDSAADEKMDWDVAPNRPANGVTADGGSHDADPRDFDPPNAIDPQTGFEVSPEDDDERFEDDYA